MIGTLLLTTLIFVTILYFAARYISDASIMDIFWGLGFILNTAVALYVAYYNNWDLSIPKLIFALLIVVWGVRLTWHILARHRGEDPRYATWRVEWGSTYWWRSYFQIFILQGVLMLLILLPVILLINAKVASYSTTLMLIGTGIWAIGFIIESIADWQLARFKENVLNRGKLLMSGLWRFSRHPNYFGEVIVWWGIFIIALSASPLVAPWYVLVIGPLTITILIRFVSGVPMTESRMQKNSHFHTYCAKTNTFIPWFSK